MEIVQDLIGKKSHPQTRGMSEVEIRKYLAALEGWSLQEGKIVKAFSFKNYYETIAFVNALAYIIHAEDHHPELIITYNRCVVKFDTHSVNEGRGGVSENDFICAAKVDALIH
ncbi:4a-hydroxytetrahydrobiopterin dehydratase [Bdellovibrio svalbardensis]|uniref:Putative pterin-4-alpha-carbinolamine dehydratase n=1 Tax=Bdellovibrio svalbardensis TaxID=2972972 RepID=A0ABT6DNR5_9BACT|nr:4a-hydroxytetrahydrobiopterin dehydratase [Bdellovibrio svalbardensis]MDG0818132.1 4a-hydroxytetrahydrobiopterin dehydratase [Bdellovibrio svalbardensis]